MNNRFLGNASCLTKYDLLIQTANTFGLPIWYITMLTEVETRNKGDRNATNYRLGNKNAKLQDAMKTMFYGDDATISEVCDQFKDQGVSTKMTTIRNNQKAGHYRIGYLNYFNHKERAAYFEGVAALIDKTIYQIIFLDPDTGINPSSKKLGAGKGSSFIQSTELKAILDIINDESIIMVQQQLTNYQYTHEDRIKDLQKDLQPNIILLVDEVIQSGIYFITKSQACYDLLTNYLWEYLTQYQFVKSNERVMLLSGSKEGISIKPLGVKEKVTIGKAKSDSITSLNETE